MRRDLLWVLAAALVSFAGCSCSSENGGTGGKKWLDLSFIAEDFFAAVVIHPKRLAESPLARELSEDVSKEMFGEISTDMGVDPRKIEQMIFLFAPHEPTGEEYEEPVDGGIIIRFAEPIAGRELMGKMFKDFDFADEQATHEGKTYYKGWYHDDFFPRGEVEHQDLGMPAGRAVHLPDDRTMVVADNEPMLKKMLSADEVKSELVERLRQLDMDNDLIVAVTTKGASGSVGKLAKEIDEELPPGTRNLLEVSDLGAAATLTADLSGDPLAKLVVEAKDADSAVRVKNLADDALKEGKSFFDKAREGILEEALPGVGESFVELVEQALDGITVTQDGQEVTVTLKRPQALAKLPKILSLIVEEGGKRAERFERDFEEHEWEIDGTPTRPEAANTPAF